MSEKRLAEMILINIQTTKIHENKDGITVFSKI
jgi:hypothetical protein